MMLHENLVEVLIFLAPNYQVYMFIICCIILASAAHMFAQRDEYIHMFGQRVQETSVSLMLLI